MKIRLRLTTILVFEFGIALLGLIIMSLFPSKAVKDHLDLVVALWFLLGVFHSLILLFKGVDFILQDASPNSLVNYYWFFTIGGAAFTAGFIENEFSDLASKIAMLWVR